MPSAEGGRSILVINPNSTKSMTDALEPIVHNAASSPTLRFTFFTAPDGPPSINSDEDGQLSTQHCAAALHESTLLRDHDAFLVACYSDHPLVAWLKRHDAVAARSCPVIGIFEASVVKAWRLVSAAAGAERSTFGIVSTGEQWERLLPAPAAEYLARVGGESAVRSFAAVATTGLNANELHEVSAEIVQSKMKEATRRLVQSAAGTLGAVCLGCAGMAGMEESVKEGCIEELGREKGLAVCIIDGVVAGVELLEEALSAT